jgi:hypothetical protein
VTAYRFVTTWRFDAPVDRVFAVLADIGRWPEWWHGVRRAELIEPGDADGVGALWRYAWRGGLPYDVRFDSRVTRVEAPHLLEGRAAGELVGTGLCRLFGDAGTTTVVYDWDVRTTRPWMNRLAPLARPLLAWNHDRVMRHGSEGLARRLGANLIGSS